MMAPTVRRASHSDTHLGIGSLLGARALHRCFGVPALLLLLHACSTLAGDVTPPTITAVETADLNQDGFIDAVRVQFDEPILDSTVQASDFDVAGVSGEAFSSTTGGDTANDNDIFLTFADGVLDTAAIPDLVFTQSGATDVTDLAGNNLANFNGHPANWWNDDYLYRKQVTVSAPVAIEAGHSARCTEDTAALIGAGRLQAGLNDWRVVYQPADAFRALSFDGTDDRVEIPDHPTLDMGGGDFTVELWLKPRNLQAGQVLVDKSDGTNGYRLITDDGNPNRLKFIRGFLLADGVSSSGSVLVNDVWQHVAAVIQGGVVTLFHNGTSIGSGGLGSASASTAGVLRIGEEVSASATIPFDGRIDEVRISDFARYPSNFTPTTTPLSPDANTVLLMHFDEGGGSVALDESGRGNHGTLTAGGGGSQTAVSQMHSTDGSVSTVRELDRLSVAASETWFKLQAPIGAAGNDTDYYLYYGFPGAGPAPADGMNVYLFWDDFDDGVLESWKWSTSVRGDISVAETGGAIRISGSNGYAYRFSVHGIVTRAQFSPPYRVESLFTIASQTTAAHENWKGNMGTGLLGIKSSGSANKRVMYYSGGWVNVADSTLDAQTFSNQRVMQLYLGSGTVRHYENGSFRGSRGGVGTAPRSMSFNYGPDRDGEAFDARFDDVKVTKYASSDPGVSQGGEVSRVTLATRDKAAPSIRMLSTADLNGDGSIDALHLELSEPVSDASVQISDFTIAGPAVAGLAFSPAANGDTADDSDIYLTFADGAHHSGITPTLTYAQSGATDLADRALVPNGLANVIMGASDGAAPVVLRHDTRDLNVDGFIDAIGVTFSEPVSDASVVANDFDVDGVAGESFSTGAAVNDALIDILFADGLLDTATTPAMAYTPDAPIDVDVADPAGNVLGDLNLQTVAWWDANYAYRKRVSVTAQSSVEAGYSVKFTEDTVALIGAGKLQAGLNDWRVVYQPSDAYRALSFDGTDDYVEVLDHRSLDFGAGDFTVEMWIRPRNLQAQQVLLDKSDGTNGFRFITDDANANRMKFIRGFLLADGVSSTNPVLVNDQWQHVAAVVQGGNVTLYHDGIAVGTGALGAASASSTVVLRVAGEATASSVIPFDGLVDEVRVSSGARYGGGFTPSMAPFASDANSVLLMHFDEGAGSVAVDESGRCNYGVLTAGGGGTQSSIPQMHSLDGAVTTTRELDRDPVAAAETWFKLQAPINGRGVDGDYYVYYGNPGAVAPPADLMNVYVVADDFEDGALDPENWTVGTSGSITVTETGGQIRITGTTTAANQHNRFGIRTVRQFTSNIRADSLFSIVSQPNVAYVNWKGSFGVTGSDGFSIKSTGSADKRVQYYDAGWFDVGDSTLEPATFANRRVGESLFASGVGWHYEDDVPLVTRSGLGTAARTLEFSYSPDTIVTFDVRFDDIKIRKAVSDEPMAGQGAETPLETVPTEDGAGPAIVAAVTLDTDNDGRIDALQITASEVVDDSTAVGSGGYDVAVYLGEAFVPAGAADDAVYQISFTEGVDPDTGALPTVTVATASLQDLSVAANPAPDQIFTGATDGALPVLVAVNAIDVGPAGLFNAAGDQLDFVFSETLGGLPTEAELEAALTFGGGAVDGDNLPSIGTGVNPFTLATTYAANDTVRVTFNAGNIANVNPVAVTTDTVQVTTGTNVTDTSGNPANTSAAPVTINRPPVAVDDSYSANEDTLLTVPAAGVLANDADPEGSPLTAVLLAGTTNGVLTLNSDGSFTYMPDLNYFGIDVFTYRASDGDGFSNAATVTITVIPGPVIPQPSVSPSVIALGESASLACNPIGGSGTYVSFLWTGPDGFTSTLQNPGIVTPSSVGLNQYAVTVTDSLGDIGTATVSLPVIQSAVDPNPMATPWLVPIGGSSSLACAPTGGTGVYVSFAWTGPNGFTSSQQNPGPISPQTPGPHIYTVTVTDATGLTASGSVAVLVGLNPESLYVRPGGVRYKVVSTSSMDRPVDLVRLKMQGLDLSPGDRLTIFFNGVFIGNLSADDGLSLDGRLRARGTLGSPPYLFTKCRVTYRPKKRMLRFVAARGVADRAGQPLVQAASGLSSPVPVAVLIDRAPADGTPDTAAIVMVSFKVKVRTRADGTVLEAGRMVK